MKVSFIIPAYNVAPYLKTCLESVLSQTHQDFEALCMDDGSNDETYSVLRDYAQKDKRIKAFHQENKGVTKTRNALLDKVSADTDFIFFLDGDDFIHPKTLSCLLNKIADADVAECAHVRVPSDAEALFSNDPETTGKPVRLIQNMDIFWTNETRIGGWINCWNKLYRWQTVKTVRFRETLAHEDDYFYGCEINALIKSKIIIPEILYFYRKNPSSLTGALNFERYVTSAVNRIFLSRDIFLKTNRVPPAYIEAFKRDLAEDAYRMIIRKNLKKNKNKNECFQLFCRACDVLNDLEKEGCISFKSLSPIKKSVLFFCRHKYFKPAKWFSRIG